MALWGHQTASAVELEIPKPITDLPVNRKPFIAPQPSYALDDRRHLDKAANLFQSFRALDSTMPLQLAYTFILCAMHEGESVGDIARRAGFATSTTSRHILDLGEFDRQKNPGYGLVETRTDPMELRRKTVHLTPKGRNLLNQVISTMRL